MHFYKIWQLMTMKSYQWWKSFIPTHWNFENPPPPNGVWLSPYYPDPRSLFKPQLNSVYWRSKLNLKLSFETQSFKPKNKKVIKTVQITWREPYLFLFLPLGVINSVKGLSKKKNYSPQNETCVRDTIVLN